MAARIATLTLNPALDIASTADKVEPTHKVRTRGEHMDPGGGGINVAKVIHALGGGVEAILLVGGVTGQLVGDLLTAAGVPIRALPSPALTRISLTVHEARTGAEYRFVPEGTAVDAGLIQNVLRTIEQLETGWLIASGSIPRGAPVDIYHQIATICRRRGCRFVLDTSGPALSAAVREGITLVKPSLRELESIVGRSLPTRRDQETEALQLVKSGAARMIVVTLGADGAFLASDDGVVHRPAIPGPVRSTVGAGDAFLGAMVLALSRDAAPRDALDWGLAAACAAVANVGTARLSRDAVEDAYQRRSGP